MEQEEQVYQKYNSFVGIKHKGSGGLAVLGRLRELRDRLVDIRLTDYQIDIVTRACDSALGNGLQEEVSPFKLHDYVIEEMLKLSDEELPRYLFYRYRYEVLPQQKILDYFPPCVQIEPASICNYRCVFCYQTDNIFNKRSQGYMGHMNFETFKLIVDKWPHGYDAIGAIQGSS